MGRFYFFTEWNTLTQTSGETFGPIDNTSYRVTSQHTSGSVANAYAICNGFILVQQSKANSNLVNLVLRPTEQPNTGLPKIQFYIYKGIQKSSLINGVEIAAASTNDLTQLLWDNQAKRNKSIEKSTGTNPNENPPAEALGWDMNDSVISDNIPLLQAFFRAESKYQLSLVTGGMHIGTFEGQFELEIVVKEMGYVPTFEVARNTNHIITVSNSGTTQAQSFSHWHDKEEVLHYLDPCAFFGSFIESGLQTKKNANSNFVKRNKSGLFNKILKKYVHKNRLYLDIRNDHNYSFNYYKNYGTDFQIDTGSGFNTENYYANNWPIQIIENPDGLKDLQVKLPKGDNTLPAVFQEENLSLLTVGDNYTDEINISLAQANGNSLASYRRLKYLKRIDLEATPSNNGTTPEVNHYLDHLFAPFDMQIAFQGNALIKSVVFDSETLVDNLPEGKQFIAKTGMAEDTTNITFFAYSATRKSVTFITDGEVSVTHNNYLDHVDVNHPQSVLRKSELKAIEGAATTPTDVPYLEFRDANDFVFEDQTKADLDDLISVVLTKSQLAELSELAKSNNFINKYRIYLATTNRLSGLDAIGHKYTEFELELRGFVLNPDNTTLSIKPVPTGIKFYSYGSV